MARISQPIKATESERLELLSMSRSHKLDSRYVLRSRIILYSLEGRRLDEIMELVGCTRMVVNKWRNRFRATGIEGLKDAARSGKPAIFDATAVHSGEIIGKSIDSNNKDNFLSFLKRLDRTYRNATLHIIVDNFSSHKHKDVKEWLSHKRKIKLHYTPTYSSWLNQVEIWFNMLSKDVLKGGIWQSTKQMADQIMEYINTYNQTRAKPFQWTYDGRKSDK